MKKITHHTHSIFLLLLLTIAVHSIHAQYNSPTSNKEEYYGPLKISFWGFICHRPTNDNGLGMDGVGDEVAIYMNSFVSVFNNLMSGRQSGLDPVYGENFLPPDNRIKAGTATVNGGLKAGDSYYREGVYGDNEPNTRSKYAIMSGWCDANTMIALLPVVFEKDKDNPVGKPVQDFDAALNRAFNDMAVRRKIFDLSNTCDQYNPGINPYAYVFNGSSLGLDNYFTGMFANWQNQLMTHPVGMLTDGQFRSKVLVFTSRMLMLLAQKDFGYGIGVIPVEYDDAAMGNTASNGKYTILLKITADIKKRQPPAPPAPPPAPVAIKQPPVIRNVVLQPAYIMNAEFLAGVWKGTMGEGSNTTGQPFSFKFNSNVFWILNEQGSAIGAGTCQFAEGQFTSTYTDATGRNWTIQSTAYNMQTGELSGTWSHSGGQSGKWMTKKISN